MKKHALTDIMALAYMLVASSPLYATPAIHPHQLDGAVARVDMKRHEIAIVPWDSQHAVWDEQHPRLFTIGVKTSVKGETSATIGEIDAGSRVVQSFHLTGIGQNGLSGTKFTIHSTSQLLHRRATVHWDSTGVVITIELPYLFGGESMPAMVGSSGATAVEGDDVSVSETGPEIRMKH